MTVCRSQYPSGPYSSVVDRSKRVPSASIPAPSSICRPAKRLAERLLKKVRSEPCTNVLVATYPVLHLPPCRQVAWTSATPFLVGFGWWASMK